MDLVHFLLEWNTYLLFNSDIVNFVWKRDDRGGAESIVLLFLFFGVALIVGGWGIMGWVRKSYLGPAEIASFSGRDLSRRSKHNSLWLVVSTGYFYILFLWAIAVSDFLPLEIHKNLVLCLSSITFTANSQADNQFYKYIYLFQILYSMKSVFY